MGKEKDLYPFVANFLKETFDCFYATEKPTGTKHGKIDVVGLRQRGGKYGGSAEVIAVEVKSTGDRFLTSAGQALGYSVMADRCYLAVGGETVGEEKRELAAQLNIGLIHITARKRCRIILTSPQYRPIRAHKLELIRELEHVECVMCGTLRPRSEMLTQNKKAIHAAAQTGKGFRYLLKGEMQLAKRERRYLCRDCVQALVA